MIILTIRTDKPEAEIGLFDDTEQQAYIIWPADRELSATIHNKLNELLKSKSKRLADVEGIVCFKGPGSFTGLRIGLTVGNALAYSLEVPVVGTMGTRWIEEGIDLLCNSDKQKIVLPEYGAAVNITLPRK